MARVFLDGRFVERDDARVSAFDAGLQHAVGLFETFQARVSGGEAYVRGLESHLRRLADSASLLGLSTTLRTDPLAEAIVTTVEQSGIETARVRLTITGGDLNMLARPRPQAQTGDAPGSTTPTTRPAGHDPTILIDVQPFTPYPEAFFTEGVAACIADAKANPLNPLEGHKTLNYWWRLRTLQEAALKRMGEALVFTITNHLAGGCVSNAFLVRDGVLFTPIARGEEQEVASAGGPSGGPVLPSPVLPGVTRAEVLEYAGERGLAVERRMLTVHDVLGADELFLTNSSWGVLPVVQVEAAAIGIGAPGPVATALRARWVEGWASGQL